MPRTEISWNSMLRKQPPCPGVLQQAGAQLAQAPPAAAAFERLPKALQEAHVEAEGKNSTVHWVPKEPSLARDSYNAMIKKQNLDITEVMMRNAMMGKAAMMGPGWDPPGVVSRKIAEILTKT